ncbi:MAG: hypothetical protein R3D51_10120 [Hyphomicrobiaceae bacterium]
MTKRDIAGAGVPSSGNWNCGGSECSVALLRLDLGLFFIVTTGSGYPEHHLQVACFS